MNVSVIVTCYNRERYVSRAIRSAISQRFPRHDFEVIVVDDHSTDHSRDIIRDFGDEVIPIFLKRNLGMAAARNTGIRRARGRCVIHLDSDDYMHDEMLAVTYMHLMMNPDWHAAACDYYLVDTNERHLERHSALVSPIACGILFRKDVLVDIGLYDPRMRLAEDEELRLRFEKHHKIGYIALPLYRYTKHDGNMSSNAKQLEHYRRKMARKHASSVRSRAPQRIAPKDK
jgi:glycosyltransferase involved in cell wall biosynthesis